MIRRARRSEFEFPRDQISDRCAYTPMLMRVGKIVRVPIL